MTEYFTDYFADRVQRMAHCGVTVATIRNKIVIKRGMSRHNLVSAQNHAENMVAPITANICITCHATLACMCQTICYVTSSNVLGRLVQCEQKGWDRGRWVGIYIYPKGENNMKVSGFGCEFPQYGHFSY